MKIVLPAMASKDHFKGLFIYSCKMKAATEVRPATLMLIMASMSDVSAGPAPLSNWMAVTSSSCARFQSRARSILRTWVLHAAGSHQTHLELLQP